MKRPGIFTKSLLTSLCLMGLVACNGGGTTSEPQEISQATQAPPGAANAQEASCRLVERGYGPQGQVNVRVEEVVTRLEVPWGIAFLPDGGMVVAERPGRLRLVRDGQLQQEAIATVPVTATGEGGLLDVAAHPDFANNRQLYLYYTTDKGGAPINRVERWILAQDGRSASADRIILDDIPAARFHNGGRLRFGPDGMLYVGTGDARDPQLSQNPNNVAGAILRLTPDGQVPSDNPFSGSAVFISGIRNTQGFDWANESTLWVTDHGPSGELGRTGHDEVSAAAAGDNLGWPTIYGCQTQQGLVAPALAWRDALPPGGAAIYTGNAIPEWRGSLLIGALRSEHLQRVVFNPENPRQVQRHEVYLQGEYGRLREVIMGPDNELYVTTSNCDGRASCPADGDKILRITR